MTGLTNALKGIGGEFEITRLLGAFGVLAYVVGANGFIVWTMIRGGDFDLIAYCTAFPAGLAVAVGGSAGATALKDRNGRCGQGQGSTGLGRRQCEAG